MHFSAITIIAIAFSSALVIFYVIEIYPTPGNAINLFAIDFYKEIIKDKDNVFCSPFSFSTVLNMLLVASLGETAAEIRKTLHYQKKISEDRSNHLYKDFLVTHQKRNSYELHIASAMWIHKDCKILSTFESSIKESYNGKAIIVDFGNKSAATDKINSWTNKQTNGKISKLFDSPISENKRLLLTNAIYFKAMWLDKFVLSSDGIFYNVDSGHISEVRVKFMFQKHYYSYTDNEILQAQVIEIPYRGKEISMIIILPHKRDGLAELETRMTLENLMNAIKNLEENIVTLKMPNFKFSTTLNLNENLKNMGIREAFTATDYAKFSGFTCANRLFVDETLQRTTIDVNKDGTIAAVISVIGVRQESGNYFDTPVEYFFTADHPFFFLIFHKSSGLFLFLGRVTKL